MPETKKGAGDGDDDAGKKRNLPSWMSSREEKNGGEKSSKQAKNHGKSQGDRASSEEQANTSSGSSSFSKLMEGVVFVLSGFVNPERSVLRSQMLEMGAEYQPDWNSNSTLLICAFPNTPKFRQVEADCGTIVSKDWISQCYNQRKLVDIESYLLNAGKPWRRQGISHKAAQDTRPSTSRKSEKQEEKGLHAEPLTSASSKVKPSNQTKGRFSPPTVKKWAVEDLKRTISWLESQDEKPEPSEIKEIAAEGVLTCLQDCIDTLKQGKDIQQIVEQWACVPRVVEELKNLDAFNGAVASSSKNDLLRQATACKRIYEEELRNVKHNSPVKKKASRTVGNKDGEDRQGYDSDDSDETVEMTEEEIDQAYNKISSTFVNAKGIS